MVADLFCQCPESFQASQNCREDAYGSCTCGFEVSTREQT